MAAHQNPSSEEIYRILSSAKTIAMVGASSRPERPSHGVMKMLLGEGYKVIPVNPNEQEVLGQKSYPSLSSISDKIDIVDVFRQPDHTPPIADEAVKIGAKALWLQLGVINEEAAQIAKAGGLSVIMDLCIAVEHRILKVSRAP
jgi:predicted CoA-binding protein